MALFALNYLKEEEEARFLWLTAKPFLSNDARKQCEIFEGLRIKFSTFDTWEDKNFQPTHVVIDEFYNELLSYKAAPVEDGGLAGLF